MLIEASMRLSFDMNVKITSISELGLKWHKNDSVLQWSDVISYYILVEKFNV